MKATTESGLSRLEANLESILSAYEVFRKASIDKEWLNGKSFTLRIFKKSTEFGRLLSKEPAHNRATTRWLDDYLKQNAISSKEDISQLVLNLNTYKERSRWRSEFITILVAVAGLAASPAAFSNSSLSMKALFSTVVGAPLILGLFDKHHTVQFSSYAQDLCYLLEQKLKSFDDSIPKQ